MSEKIEHNCDPATRYIFYSVDCPKCKVNELRAQRSYSVEMDPDLSMTFAEPRFGRKKSLSEYDRDWDQNLEGL